MTRDAQVTGTLRIMVLPRDENPYQELLYEAMARYGVEVRYLSELTGSRTMSLLLLPAEIVWSRARGYRVAHLHWVFGFSLPGRKRLRLMGLLSQAWFHVVLGTLRATRTRVVWTAHNVLPHEPVFWDDVAARRALLRCTDLVICHSESALAEIQVRLASPRSSVVIPHGPFLMDPAPRAAEVGTTSDGIVVGFVGVVATYKGVDDLIAAFSQVAPPRAKLIVAGECRDPEYAERLVSAAQRLPGQIDLRLRRLTDTELAAVLHEVDVVTLPFRRVTTSGSALLSLGAGRPLVVPDLPSLADLPGDAVVRYPPTSGLADALRRVLSTPRPELAAMGARGRESVALRSWDDVAAATLAAMDPVGGHPRESVT